MTATDLHDRLSSTPGAAHDFGDVRGEFNALLSACGVYDLSRRAKIALTGGERVRWLNGMVTNNIRDLAVGHGVYAFLLNPQGHILGDLYAYNRGESLLLETDQSQLDKILATFDHYIIMDDVEVTNLSGRLTGIGIAGPKARGVLLSVGMQLPQDPLQFIERGQNGAVVRGDNPAVESYEVWMAASDAAGAWDVIVKAGAIPVGTAALELLRIASGVPRYGQDIRERDLPQETEQLRAVHFSKGCYVGQEIVERIRSRGSVHRKFSGFLLEGPSVAGTKVQADGKDVGELTSVASLPAAQGEYAVALGYIRREISSSGKQVEAGSARATVANLPFTEIFKS